MKRWFKVILMFGLAAMVTVIYVIIPGETRAFPVSIPKLFWFDCGPTGDCTNASLYYLDPTAVPPTKTLFMSGVGIRRDDWENHSIPTGTVDAGTYLVSNLKTGYIIYFKDGKIYSVDTTTLATSQLSNETGISADQLCEFHTFTDWQTPLNSTINYNLAGTDNECYTDDDVQKAVKLSTVSTSAPISLTSKQIQELLFNGKYLVWNTSTSPNKVQICSSTLTSCTKIAETTGDFRNLKEGGLDGSRVLFMIDGTWSDDNYLGGKLMIYDYTKTDPPVTLYTVPSNKMIADVRIDRDGFVYFVLLSTTSPYTGTLKKVAYTGGTVTNLYSFTPPAAVPQDYVWMDLSPSYVVVYYPNGTSGTALSVKKDGTTAVTLTSAFVNGGVIGDYFYYEDTSAYVRRKLLDNTGLISKSNAMLVGTTLGGSGDWYYGFDSSTFRGFIETIGNVLKSYTISDDISVGSAGTTLGTIPANLGNVMGDGWDNDMLIVAEKRNTDFSYGADILYFDAATASTLKRMTNNTGPKGSLSNSKH